MFLVVVVLVLLLLAQFLGSSLAVCRAVRPRRLHRLLDVSFFPSFLSFPAPFVRVHILLVLLHVFFGLPRRTACTTLPHLPVLLTHDVGV